MCIVIFNKLAFKDLFNTCPSNIDSNMKYDSVTNTWSILCCFFPWICFQKHVCNNISFLKFYFIELLTQMLLIFPFHSFLPYQRLRGSVKLIHYRCRVQSSIAFVDLAALSFPWFLNSSIRTKISKKHLPLLTTRTSSGKGPSWRQIDLISFLPLAFF